MSSTLETVGSLLALPAILAVAGVAVFEFGVFTGSTEAKRRLVAVSIAASFAALAGAILETYGTFGMLGLSWSDAIADERTWGPLMRWFASALAAVGFTMEMGRVNRSQRSDSDLSPWGVGLAVGVFGAALGVFSFAFDGHTVTEGARVVHFLVNVAHAGAGAVWLGGLLALVALRSYRDVPGSWATMLVRFSVIATAALAVVGLAGVAMSWLIADGLSDFVTTPWGRILLLKVGLVFLAMGIGAFNHIRLVPVLKEDPGDDGFLVTAKKAVAVESGILLLVAVVTVFLTAASTD